MTLNQRRWSHIVEAMQSHTPIPSLRILHQPTLLCRQHHLP